MIHDNKHDGLYTVLSELKKIIYILLNFILKNWFFTILPSLLSPKLVSMLCNENPNPKRAREKLKELLKSYEDIKKHWKQEF